MIYVLTALGWSAAGFVLGYVVGKAAREVHQIKEAVVGDEGDHRTKNILFRRFELDQLIGALVVILAVVSIVVMVKQINDRQAEIECRADILNQTIGVLDRRGQIAGQDRAALDRFMSRVFSPGTTERTTRRAYLEYTRTIAENSEARTGLHYPEDDC